jgi:alpha-methylacyl-CoA racemase
VLSLSEAPEHPHALARNAFVEVGGIRQPGPAPRFGRTEAARPAPPPRPGADTDAVLAGLGLSEAAITDLRADGVVG